MEIGKLPNDVLEKIVFDNISNKREEVLVGAAIGEDNAIIDFGEKVCIMSTDPITGATKGIGSLAVHISCNDIASSGAEPIGVLLTILAPPKTTREDIESIMKDAGRASRQLNVEIMGGHTEITDAVTRVVISTTVIGRQDRKNMLDAKKVSIGDKILLTKYAGIEGTSIIAKELEDYLKDKIDEKSIKQAQDMGKYISVVKDGIICGKAGAKYMHDITEGGVLGAIWEGASATDKGMKIYKNSIPMKDITKDITSILDIDPYRLISSGSMLVIAGEDKVKTIESELEKEGIKITIIGEVIEGGVYMEENGRTQEIEPPSSDELYRALSIEN